MWDKEKCRGGNLSNVGRAKMLKAPTGLALDLEAKNAPTFTFMSMKFLVSK